MTLILIVAFLIGVGWLARKAQLLREDRFGALLISAMETHKVALISYHHQSIRQDQFGNIDNSKWMRHVDTFLSTQVLDRSINYRTWKSSKLGTKCIMIVDGWTQREISSGRAAVSLTAIDVYKLTAIQYEQLCAEALRSSGWQVRTTPATADGGADLVAEKGSNRLIVQCKRYTKPVGNKAVQEVHSAVRLYHGNLACVVAPSGFTRQAQEEAHGLGIALLHHSALERYDWQMES